MIVAKSVVPNQYWILKQDDRKVGNIEAGPDGFQVRLNDRVQQFKNLHTIEQQVHIDFEPVLAASKPAVINQVNGYHTTSFPYNAIYDVKHQVPLWTRDDRSKSWYTAGWYKIKKGRSWSVVECPKLITLERYTYQGPYHSQAEALAS